MALRGKIGRMAKLYFRYGTMGSAKTLNLLAVAHNYEQQHKAVRILKPEVDTRFGEKTVHSRAGLSREADIIVKPEDDILDRIPRNLACLLVDEAQFLSARVVDQLREVATFLKIPVICYGLRTNFKGQLFEGSKRLVELADSLEEIKTTCAYCTKKATMNLKFAAKGEGSDPHEVEMGAEDKYMPACYPCYRQRSKHFIPADEQAREKKAIV